ncbi:MAG: hypothetical protein ACEPOV_11735 [Hyphomicrobiales bacterium]
MSSGKVISVENESYIVETETGETITCTYESGEETIQEGDNVEYSVDRYPPFILHKRKKPTSQIFDPSKGL